MLPQCTVGLDPVRGPCPGQCVLPRYECDVNTVFQDYALFAHMSVGDNVAYGLMIKKVPTNERRERASEALRMVRLDGYESRKPAQLSILAWPGYVEDGSTDPM